MAYNNWKEGLRDLKTPFTLIDSMTHRRVFPEKWPIHPRRDEIRDRFFQIMRDEFKASIDIENDPDQLHRIPIFQIQKALGQTCTHFKAEIEKESVRIELRDIYKLTGIRVTQKGQIKFDY